ncbi:hypothetical protein HY643_00320 [Candidatus Woesearchaeota archaeon]|nr:hypothetical protein [Candidatus Woesearchaeota archaeon]
MKALVFDTSSIISLATNNLLWILQPLKQKFGGEFAIPGEVKKEVVDVPLQTKKFKLEAIQVRMQIRDGIISLHRDAGLQSATNNVCMLANSIFRAKDRNMQIVHPGEVAVLVLAKKFDSAVCVIDERTIRVLVENPEKLAELLSSKLHTNITINRENLKKFQQEFGNLKIIRSVELGVMAYELGLLNNYIREDPSREAKNTLLSGLLWALKLKGCAISIEEIDEALVLEGLK